MTTKQPLENTYDYSAEKKMIRLSEVKQTAEQELYKIAEFIENASHILIAHKDYLISSTGEALKLTAEDVRKYTKILSGSEIPNNSNEK